MFEEVANLSPHTLAEMHGAQCRRCEMRWTKIEMDPRGENILSLSKSRKKNGRPKSVLSVYLNYLLGNPPHLPITTSSSFMTSKHDTPLVPCHVETAVSFVTEAILQGLEGVTIVTDIEVKTWTEKFGCWTKNRGKHPPKWMVKIMENPMSKWMIGGYHYFRKHPNRQKPTQNRNIIFKTTGWKIMEGTV